MATVPFHVILLNEALADLQRIAQHVRVDSPQNAPLVAKMIVDAIDSLGLMPNRFRRVGKTRKRQSTVHAMSVPPFIVYYRVFVQAKAVRVMAVRHGAQKQPRRFR